MPKVVPPERFEAEYQKMAQVQFTSLSRHTVFRATENTYNHARRIVPVAADDGGTARSGLMPSFGEPADAMAQQPGPKSDPGPGRINRLKGRNKIGEHGFVTFKALSLKGYDYAGNLDQQSLERGYSPQAPRGVLGPSRENTIRVKRRLIRKAVADSESELRRAGF